MNARSEKPGESYHWIMQATGEERDRRILIVANDRDSFAARLFWSRATRIEEEPEEEPVNTESVNDR